MGVKIKRGYYVFWLIFHDRPVQPHQRKAETFWIVWLNVRLYRKIIKIRIAILFCHPKQANIPYDRRSIFTALCFTFSNMTLLKTVKSKRRPLLNCAALNGTDSEPISNATRFSFQLQIKVGRNARTWVQARNGAPSCGVAFVIPERIVLIKAGGRWKSAANKRISQQAPASRPQPTCGPPLLKRRAERYLTAFLIFTTAKVALFLKGIAPSTKEIKARNIHSKSDPRGNDRPDECSSKLLLNEATFRSIVISWTLRKHALCKEINPEQFICH